MLTQSPPPQIGPTISSQKLPMHQARRAALIRSTSHRSLSGNLLLVAFTSLPDPLQTDEAKEMELMEQMYRHGHCKEKTLRTVLYITRDKMGPGAGGHREGTPDLSSSPQVLFVGRRSSLRAAVCSVQGAAHKMALC